MKKSHIAILSFVCLTAAAGGVDSSGSPPDGPADGARGAQNYKCADNGAGGQAVFIIPRVYISYTGKSGCWSEIRYVEVPVDFLKLQEIARRKGDSPTQKIMSREWLVDFFAWLLENGVYGMPGDALAGIFGYLHRDDYEGLYKLFRLYSESRGRGGTE